MKEPDLTASDLAELLGISRRKATGALARMARGQAYRGFHVPVSIVRDAGVGRGGCCYMVASGDLPLAWTVRTTNREASTSERAVTTVPPRLTFSRPCGGTKHPEWRLALIEHVVQAGPLGSPARGRAIAQIAAVSTYPAGKKAGKPIGATTLRAWVATYEARGMVPLLARKDRADRGQARVVAWRAWDQAMTAAGVPEARQREMAEALRQEARGFFLGGVQVPRTVADFLRPTCRRLAAEAGIRLPEPAFDVLCTPPTFFVDKPELKRVRKAAKMRDDAAAFNGKDVSRIRRDRTGLLPMDLVAGDVRVHDVLTTREDGTPVTARTVAFMDVATQRLFCRLFIFPRGEGMRREHVLLTLRDMFADPAWGIPKTLILDNGGEFNVGEAASDIARIATLVRDVHGLELACFPSDALPDRIGVLNSRAYQPQGKGWIEGAFSILTRSIEPMVKGFIGGNRMVKRTANLGRAPAARQGSLADHEALFQLEIDYYHARRQQRGHIKGLSPLEAFARLCKGRDGQPGWQPVLLAGGEFELAFGKDVVRTVQGGKFQHAGRVFYSDALLALEHGERVKVRVPILGDGSRVAVLDGKGGFLCVAEEERAFDVLDPAGVREHDRRRRALRDGTKALAAGLKPLDPEERMREVAALHPKVEPPAPLATVSIHPALAAAAAEPSEPAPVRRRAPGNDAMREWAARLKEKEARRLAG